MSPLHREKELFVKSVCASEPDFKPYTSTRLLQNQLEVLSTFYDSNVCLGKNDKQLRDLK